MEGHSTKIRAIAVVAVCLFSAAVRGDVFAVRNPPVGGPGFPTIIQFDKSGQYVSSFTTNQIFESVDGLANDSTTLYAISNSVGFGEIHELSIATGQEVKVAFTISAGGKQLTIPSDATVGPDGFVYVASNLIANNSSSVTNIFRVNPTTFAASLVLPLPAGFSDVIASPQFGPDGNLYFTSGSIAQGSSKVWKFNTSTQDLAQLIPAPGGTFNGGDIGFGPNGNLFVASSTGVSQFNPLTGAFINDFIPTGTGGMGTPIDMLFGPDGHLYIDDTQHRLLRFDSVTGQFLDTYVAPGSYPAGSITEMVFVPEPITLIPLLAAAALIRRRRSRLNKHHLQFVPKPA